MSFSGLGTKGAHTGFRDTVHICVSEVGEGGGGGGFESRDLFWKSSITTPNFLFFFLYFQD